MRAHFPEQWLVIEPKIHLENRLFGVSARFELSGVDSVTGIPIPVRTFIPKSRPDFALKSRIQSVIYGKLPKNVLDTSFC